MKRIGLDLILVVCIFVFFALSNYFDLPNVLNLAVYKMLLVSLGIIHAHVARKLLFPRLDWSKQITGGHYVAIAFYVVIPICYAFGG